jgi:phosphosulfolactate phosphohydrolase-like enzyme
VIPADRLIKPTIGPGGLTRNQAVAEVQALLDRAALITLAEVWRRGAVDDTVYAGPFTWTVYEHPDGADPRIAALEWLEDFAATMRSAGLRNVQVAKLP